MAGGRLAAEIGARGYDPFGPDGANFNLLIGRDVLDPVSGTPSQRAYLCGSGAQRLCKRLAAVCGEHPP